MQNDVNVNNVENGLMNGSYIGCYYTFPMIVDVQVYAKMHVDKTIFKFEVIFLERIRP